MNNQTHHQQETIVAIATAPGRSSVGIVRISGSHLLSFAKALCGKTPKPRTAMYTDFLDAQGEVIDNGLLLYFPAPASFTGEDIIELQGHGGQVVLNLLLERCLELGARLALAGEFSKRAFFNGKIDLVQAESIIDLIDASSRSTARMATRSLKGVFSEHIHKLNSEIIELRMLVEATLDFPEEEIDFLKQARAKERVQAIEQQIHHTLNSAEQGAILREGIHIVLLGEPNVGKSSLLNALVGEEVAIVTDIAGTTRDSVHREISLSGVPLHLVDTAGIHDTTDKVEQIGIARSYREAQEADVILILLDPQTETLNATIEQQLQTLPEHIHRLFVVNKIDLYNKLPHFDEQNQRIYLSAKTLNGLDCLKEVLLKIVGWQGESDSLFLARTRHVQALQLALKEIEEAMACLSSESNLELLAEHLRLAHNELGQITGEFTADDLLGVIFSRFCIGK